MDNGVRIRLVAERAINPVSAWSKTSYQRWSRDKGKRKMRVEKVKC